jgi:hypothetical protein
MKAVKLGRASYTRAPTGDTGDSGDKPENMAHILSPVSMVNW